MNEQQEIKITSTKKNRFYSRNAWYSSLYNSSSSLPTNSMKQGTSWEANNDSASHEIPCLLWNPKVHYRVHKTSPHWSQSWARCIHSSPSHPISLRSILISFHLCLGLPSGLFLSGFPNKILYAFLTSPMCSTCPAHLILLYLMTLITCGEVYKLRSVNCDCPTFWWRDTTIYLVLSLFTYRLTSLLAS